LYQYKQAIKSAMQDIDRQFNDNLYEKLCKNNDSPGPRQPTVYS